MSFHMAHLSYGNYIVRVNTRVTTTWPLAFFGGSGFELQRTGKTKKYSVQHMANEE